MSAMPTHLHREYFVAGQPWRVQSPTEWSTQDHCHSYRQHKEPGQLGETHIILSYHVSAAAEGITTDV